MDENIALIDIIADGGPLPEDIVADAELLSALLRELEQLSARERRILELASTVPSVRRQNRWAFRGTRSLTSGRSFGQGLLRSSSPIAD